MPRTDATRLTGFIEPHLGALRRAAYRLCRSAADAEDLVQEVCVRAYEKLGELDAVAAPRAWLLRVQYHLHVDGVRRARPRTESFDDPHLRDEEPVACADDPEQDAEGAALGERLSAAWPSLNADQQALLALHAEGYTLAELCEITGLPLSALKARLHRARVRLGKLLQQQAPAARAVAGRGEPR